MLTTWATLYSATSIRAVTITLCEPSTRGRHPGVSGVPRSPASTENSNALIPSGRLTMGACFPKTKVCAVEQVVEMRGLTANPHSEALVRALARVAEGSEKQKR